MLDMTWAVRQRGGGRVGVSHYLDCNRFADFCYTAGDIIHVTDGIDSMSNTAPTMLFAPAPLPQHHSQASFLTFLLSVTFITSFITFHYIFSNPWGSSRWKNISRETLHSRFSRPGKGVGGGWRDRSGFTGNCSRLFLSFRDGLWHIFRPRLIFQVSGRWG